MTTKNILVVAGGKWQVPLVKRAKELGYRVYNVNPYADSPGFRYADETLELDVLDREAILGAIRARGWTIDGVVTDQSDIAVPTVAYLAEALGLPGLSLEHAELFTNKFRMREFARAQGAPVPDYTLIRSAEALEDFAGRGFRVIVKPVNAQSSRGISVLPESPDPASVARAYEEARRYSHGGEGIIAEAFVAGTEFTVDGIFLGGRHKTLAISRKTHFDFNGTIAQGLWFGPLIPELVRQHDRLMEASGVQLALTHTEYILHEGQYYLVEMAARGGGTLISSHIVPAVSGLDNYRALLASAVGSLTVEEQARQPVHSDTPYAVLYFFDHRDLAWDGDSMRAREEALRKLREEPWILDIDIDVDLSSGRAPEQPKDDRSRIGHVILVAETEAELHDRLEQVKARL